MSKSKKAALIGVIVAIIIAVLNFIIELGQMSNLYAKNSDVQNSGLLIAGASIFILAFGITLTLLKFFAFKRIDTHKEKPWKIFLLVVGIFASLQAVIILVSGKVIGLLTLVMGVLFVLSFALKES
jgi:uncharacterized membrane protein